MYFMSGESFQVDQASPFPCSYNVGMVKGYKRHIIDHAHILEIGKSNEISCGVRVEVHEFDETVFVNRIYSVSGLQKWITRQLHDHEDNRFLYTPSGTHEIAVRSTANVPLKM
jgi:hypothetical protein